MTSFDNNSLPKGTINAFNKWKNATNKIYSSPEEEHFRLTVFAKTYEQVKATNAKNLSWKAGLNEFSDMTDEELSAKYLMQELPENYGDIPTIFGSNDNPTEIDWSKSKYLTPEVQDQGRCGSCWAF